MNVLRYHLMHSMNLDNFELSQNYTLFYDKLEKSNYFLENILETLGRTHRRTPDRLAFKISAGRRGQWDMICSLIMKYGVVPKYVMPETAVSSMTKEMNGYLTEKLREFACRLRREFREGKPAEELRAEKEEMLKTILPDSLYLPG